MCGTVAQRDCWHLGIPVMERRIREQSLRSLPPGRTRRHVRGPVGDVLALRDVGLYDVFVTIDGYVNYTLSPTGSYKNEQDNLEHWQLLQRPHWNANDVSTLVTDITNVNNVIWQFESILKCDFISNTFWWVQPGCNEAVDAIQLMWRGFIITATGYLCLWITMLVTIGRMSNADLMIDGGKFNAKKAGLI